MPKSGTPTPSGSANAERSQPACQLCGEIAKRRHLTPDYDRELQKHLYSDAEAQRGLLCNRCKYTVEVVEDIGLSKMVRYFIRPFYVGPWEKCWEVMKQDSEVISMIKYLTENVRIKT